MLPSSSFVTSFFFFHHSTPTTIQFWFLQQWSVSIGCYRSKKNNKKRRNVYFQFGVKTTSGNLLFDFLINFHSFFFISQFSFNFTIFFFSYFFYLFPFCNKLESLKSKKNENNENSLNQHHSITNISFIYWWKSGSCEWIVSFYCPRHCQFSPPLLKILSWSLSNLPSNVCVHEQYRQHIFLWYLRHNITEKIVFTRHFSWTHGCITYHIKKICVLSNKTVANVESTSYK